MKSIILIFAFLFPCTWSFAQITIYTVQPVTNSPGGNPLKVQIRISSTYQIDTAKANVLNRQTLLVYNPSTAYFEGYISLTGLTEGLFYQLALDVADVNGYHKLDIVRFVYDLPPIVTVDSPLNFSVAHPTLPLSLKWQDMDSCNVSVLFPGSEGDVVLYNAKHKDSLKTTLNLAAFDGKYDKLRISVTDARNQQTISYLLIYCDNSPFLVPYYVSDKLILDFNYNQLLVADTGLSNPSLINVTTNQQNVIPYRLNLTSFIENGFNSSNQPSYVTPYGAIMSGVDSTNLSYLFDWNAGNMYSLGNLESESSLRQSGDYAIWSNGATLKRRDLLRKKNVTVSTNAGNTDNDVAENGIVAFWDKNYDINKYDNGVVTTLTHSDGNIENVYPVTDGTNIVYKTYNINNGSVDARIITGNTDTFLSAVNSDYMVNNKFTAYLKIGTSGQTQVWVRDSAGNNVQRSFFGSDSYVEAVNPHGDLAIIAHIKNSRRFISERNGSSTEISSGLGKVYYRDSTWYVAIGRVLYKVDTQALLPLRLVTFTANKEGSYNILKWTTSQEMNAAYTSIERSSNGNEFIGIGRISANNNLLTSQYSFIDANPLPAVSYYRLKFIDKDGRYEYSPVRIVKNNKGFAVSIYPNPAKNMLSLYFKTAQAKQVSVTILNTEGQFVQQSAFLIAMGTAVKSLNISRLSKGSYYLQINIEGQESMSFRFEKI